MSARLDIDAIRHDNPMPGIAGRLVKLRQAGREWEALCPFHSERTPSFRLYRGRDGEWRGQCFGCGWHGDVLDFTMQAHGVSLVEAARMLGAGEVPAIELPAMPPAEQADRTAEARAIWQRAIPAAGTLAETYLRWRCIADPFPPDIRFLPLPCDNLGALPCLVAALRNVAGEVTGLQRIWLAADGRGKANVAKPKRSLGHVKGSAIRLGELDGSGVLTVCEGPEDGLSLVEMLGAPVWVAAGATFLPAMEFPPEVRSIVIAADNDASGKEWADKAARAYAERGLPVRILRPLDGFKDFNDELMDELMGVRHGCAA
ncbi:MAG: toprim domain-containing protein [Betaproteobacteria bacterium]|nr:toprim domain-containing protein [Betaproteobacteria bacterium]